MFVIEAYYIKFQEKELMLKKYFQRPPLLNGDDVTAKSFLYAGNLLFFRIAHFNQKQQETYLYLILT